MNSDTYHAFMMDHAGGALSSDMAIAAELHILLSETGHKTADIWDAARHVLALEAAPEADCEHAFLPEALELACSEFSTVPWKRGLSGVHYAKRGRGKGKLMRLDPGQAAPEHSHSALEATVVLKGQFEDGHGVYGRGDLVLGRPGVRHRPAAHGEEMCICFVAQEPLPFWRLS
ncbi:MAG: cupin domain-containing protein [Hyphomonas sp.]|nr:cupin domain-containing protein [Hyphomonas sp.]